MLSFYNRPLYVTYNHCMFFSVCHSGVYISTLPSMWLIKEHLHRFIHISTWLCNVKHPFVHYKEFIISYPSCIFKIKNILAPCYIYAIHINGYVILSRYYMRKNQYWLKYYNVSIADQKKTLQLMRFSALFVSPACLFM